MIRFLTCLLILAAPLPALAGSSVTDESEFFNLERASLEELLNLKTSVASLTPMGLRETPGLVTVMTEEDIRLSGARDLVDLLRLVPDFEFTVDVQGNLGLGVKGNSGNEGKVLLLWDGQPYNELLYSTIQYDRFPVDQMERIEIIRGPGSVIYGGAAELAVINIVTKTARFLDGSRVYAGYGQMREARGREFAGYSFGKVYGETKFSALAHVSSAQRSDRRYRDLAGDSYGMNGDSGLDSKNLNLSLETKGLSLRFIADDYSQVERDHFTSLLSTGGTRVKFPVYSFEAKYSFRAAENLKLEPGLAYQYSRPWKEIDEHFPYDKTVKRYTGGFTALYEPSDKVSLLGGAEFTHDMVDVGGATGAGSAYSGTRTGARYDNLAFFAQTAMNMDIFNLIAGGRIDRHSHTGPSLVPRLAVTKLLKDLHFKAIYSGAFRAPSIENIRLNPAIKPERTTTAEFEAGYKASEALFLSADVFDITIKRPIIFFYDPVADTENYLNYSRTGTRGYGLALKFKKKGDFLELGYSTYRSDKNRVDVYKPLTDSSAALAFPKHKAVLNSRYQFGERLTASPSIIYLSKRYGYYASGATRSYSALTQANIYFSMKDCFTKGLELGLGAYDLFGSNYSYIQAYNSEHAPLPAASREIFLKAVYAF
ncbi:MAG: TonB-dependent receptor plug domain-containing protein [Elusimicrobia bacterium]|nr:TonB-dependent receptor plug domain-containing protein [Elusimicrobiota bacterium]